MRVQLCLTFDEQVWSHFDAGSCPGSAVGVKIILDNGVSGFLHTKNISDKHIKSPEERVKVGSQGQGYIEISCCNQMSEMLALCGFVFVSDWNDDTLSHHQNRHRSVPG